MNTSWRTWRASFYILLLGVLVACSSSDTAPTVTLTASPDTISVGESSELSWTLSGDDPITLALSPDVGVDLVSPLTVSPTETTTYTLTATNDAGSNSASVTITVQPDDSQPEPPAPTIDAFTASVSDLTATFTWTLTASESVGCTVDFGDGSAVQTLGNCLGTQTVTHTYESAGTYAATLALTSGATATTAVTVVGSGVEPTDCSADFVITNQGDLEALSSCGVIGSLTIDPTAEVSSQQTDDDPITSLAPLAGLTVITRSLVIANTGLETLAGLEGLVSVGGDITIRDNDALLSLAGLENIAGYDDSNVVTVVDNNSLDCSQPALPFAVDVSQGNAVDCEVSAEAPVNSVRFLAPLDYTPSLNIFVPLTAGISERVTIERYGTTVNPLTVQLQVVTPPSTIVLEDIRVNNARIGETFEVTFPAFRSRTTFNLRVVNDALDDVPELLVLAFVETTDYGLVDPSELRFDVQEPVIIADVCRGKIVVTTQSELEQLSECTIIDGNLTIDPTAESSFLSLQQTDPIVSLQPLASVTTITGSLTIRNTSLVNFNGLQSLTVIGGSLTVFGNNALVSMAALSITSIGGDIVIQANVVLVALFDFGNLVGFDNGNGVTISNNDSLDCLSIEVQLGSIIVDISTGNGVNCPTEIDIRFVDLNVCNVWSALDSGGNGETVVDWDISAIPEGAIFDIRYNTLNIPDSIVSIYPIGDAFPLENPQSDPGIDYPVINYPADTVQLDTGWRGNPFFNGDPVTYPGGIVGPGLGQELGFFTKGEEDAFRIIVTGRDPGTLWGYEVRCRLPEDPVVVPLAITSFTATPDAIEAGESSTLAWSITGINPIDLTITADVGANVGDVSSLDSIVVEPTETTTYTLTASNDSGMVTETVTVTVTEPEPVAPTITSFTATPDSINSGETSTLAWEVTGDEPVTLTIEPDVGDVSGLDSVEVSPTETTTYTLTAENGTGSVTAQVTIVVTDAITGQECDGAFVESLAELEALRGCEIITGNLRISESTDIVNLEPLNSLLEVQGSLNIYDNSALTSLAGLENLTSVRGRFGLARAGSVTTGANDILSSIDSLANLATIEGDFYFRRNNLLPSLSLPSLTSVGGNIFLESNSSVTSITFGSLVSVGGSINIGGGNALRGGVNAATSIDFGNLTSLGDSLNIEVNLGLESVDFGMLSTIPGDLLIAGNDLLTQIDFDSLTTIAGNMSFGAFARGGNDSLVSFAGLSNLSAIGGNFTLRDNISLLSLTELENLVTVGGEVNIDGNDVLQSLVGLQNIRDYDDINGVSIVDNQSLDCTPPPVLPFIVDSSSGNLVDCPTN